jgi:hypothetical protein
VSAVTLRSERGTSVRVAQAAMRQGCRPCGLTISAGDWICQVGRSDWAHLEHLERLLLEHGEDGP